MQPDPLRKLTKALLAAFVLTLFLALVPLILSAKADFLGKDVSGLAASIVSYYPSYFINELLKVLGVVFTTLFVFALPASIVSAKAGTRRARRWLAVGLPSAAVICLFLSSLYRYPALYETLVPEWVSGVVFRTAGVLSPMFFMVLLAAIACSYAVVYCALSVDKRRAVARALGVGVVGSGLLVWNGCSGSLQADHLRDQPNILFLAIDSLRFDHLNQEITPNLFALKESQETVSFDNHYVGVPRTFPSWVEMLYSRNAPQTHVRHMFPGFGDRRQQTEPLPKVLAGQGYRTFVVSDFAGDIFPRFETGFDAVRAPSMNLRGLIELAVHQKFVLFLPFTTSSFFADFFPSLTQNPAFANPHRLVKTFVSEANRSDVAPWFGTIFYSTAHFPYAAPYPYYRAFTKTSYPGPFYFQKNPDITGDDVLLSDNIEQTRNLYSGALHSIDASVGEIIDQLKQSGQWEHTIVVLTADHGEDLYENGRLQGHGEHLFGHNVIKVPFLMRIPGYDFADHKDVSFLSRSIDVAPTLLGAINVAMPGSLGSNLFPFVSDPNQKAPDLVAYSETGIWFSASGKGDFQSKRLKYPGISGLLNFDHGMSQEIVLNPAYEKVVATAKHRSVIRGGYKLIYMPTESGVLYALFDEVNDPENLHDLVAEKPKLFASMKDLFFQTVHKMNPRVALVDDFIVGR